MDALKGEMEELVKAKDAQHNGQIQEMRNTLAGIRSELQRRSARSTRAAIRRTWSRCARISDASWRGMRLFSVASQSQQPPSRIPLGGALPGY